MSASGRRALRDATIRAMPFRSPERGTRGKEFACDLKNVSRAGAGWLARLSCGSEGYESTLTSRWEIAPNGYLRETVENCRPSKSGDKAACQGVTGQSNEYVRCKA